MTLPAPFTDWFAQRGWTIHPHQQDMLTRKDAPALLLIAPTGGGKTLAGFLPSLVELADGAHAGLHTLYVSPPPYPFDDPRKPRAAHVIRRRTAHLQRAATCDHRRDPCPVREQTRRPTHARHVCPILQADPGPDPDIQMLVTDEQPPWTGGGGKYAIPAVLEQVKQHNTTLIFHNTRAQAEIFFHNLWLANDDSLPRRCWYLQTSLRSSNALPPLRP